MVEIRKLRSGDTAIDGYIEELENHILSFETSNIKKLIISADNLAGVIAKDLDIIAGNTRGELKILSDDKEGKLFDRAMSVISKIKDFNVVSELTNAVKAKQQEEEKKDEEGINSGKTKLNAMERIILKKK